MHLDIPDHWAWFPESKFGMFIHWGPYAQLGHGEQVMFRDHLDPDEYIARACSWSPEHYDPRVWARVARDAGMKYACLTTRHHDGYCLWDSKYTDYTSAKQAPKRDLVREYVDAFRAEGLKVGLYYSWCDWRLPAYYESPEKAPEAWATIRQYLHNQVLELLTNYGQIDYFFFDGSWPRSANELQSLELVEKMRALQPQILINNRLGTIEVNEADTANENVHGSEKSPGDFGTPEHTIRAENRLWESCQVSTWRLWGYASGERWRPADFLLDMLCECAEKGGNLIMNVGPQADGRLPAGFVTSMEQIGRWLQVNGEAIYNTEAGNLTEFITRGRQTIKNNKLYLIIRFWDGQPQMRVNDLVADVQDVTLLSTGASLPFEMDGDNLIIKGLPAENPSELFAVLRVTCAERPQTNQWGCERLWEGDPQRVADWARTRSGLSVNV
jgi:alpha-L-fucosidase